MRCRVQEHPDLGTCYAHSGILAAAKAVWADLEEHGILQVAMCICRDACTAVLEVTCTLDGGALLLHGT